MSYPHPEEVEIPAIFVSHVTGMALVESLAANPTVKPITVRRVRVRSGGLSLTHSHTHTHTHARAHTHTQKPLASLSHK